MSNGSSAALAVGLGVASGAAIWFFTRDKAKPTAAKTDPPTADTPASNPPSASTSPTPGGSTVGAPPPRVPGPCSLKVDRLGLTADGEPVTIETAVERCKAAGKVEWLVLPDAPSAVVVELAKALNAAKLPITMKK